MTEYQNHKWHDIWTLWCCEKKCNRVPGFTLYGIVTLTEENIYHHKN